MSPRLRAFLVHLSASALVLAAFTSLVLLWWYPGPLLELQGGWNVLIVLLTVDVILGPMMTGIVFRPGKKWLVLDLAVIVVVQIAALAYGAMSIYVQRPSYLAFAYDRYFLVSSMDAVGQLPSDAQFPTWRANVRLATARVTPLTTSESLDGLETLGEDNLIPPLVIMAADVKPYALDDIHEAVNRGRAVTEIDDATLRDAALSRLQAQSIDPTAIRAYRVIGRKATAMAIIRPQDSQVIDILR
jgi:hypothetical protein